MATKIADDTSAIKAGMERIKREKDAILNGGEKAVMKGQSGTLEYTFQSWSDEQVQDGQSPPLELLENYTSDAYGTQRWRYKTQGQMAITIPPDRY